MINKASHFDSMENIQKPDKGRNKGLWVMLEARRELLSLNLTWWE